MSLKAKIHSAEEMMVHIETSIREALVGTRVRLLKGDYKGREGVISYIQFLQGRIAALVYVERFDGTDVLNSRPETRQYWSLDDLEEVP